VFAVALGLVGGFAGVVIGNIPAIGLIFAALLNLGIFGVVVILAVFGIVNANSGKAKELPIVGTYKILL
jgi:uncharacterized membrane protein